MAKSLLRIKLFGKNGSKLKGHLYHAELIIQYNVYDIYHMVGHFSSHLKHVSMFLPHLFVDLDYLIFQKVQLIHGVTSKTRDPFGIFGVGFNRSTACTRHILKYKIIVLFYNALIDDGIYSYWKNGG